MDLHIESLHFEVYANSGEYMVTDLLSPCQKHGPGVWGQTQDLHVNRGNTDFLLGSLSCVEVYLAIYQCMQEPTKV